MANSFVYNNHPFNVGDTISLHYKIKEGDKERIQIFKGILIGVKGQTPQTRTITVRKLSNMGIGVEKIVPLASPFLEDIKLIKKTTYKKAKAYFIRNFSEAEIRRRLYKSKKSKSQNNAN
jgi:large subunit ribosomal protein L19